MNEMNINDYDICGRCGAQFQGIKCPQCGLVMCKNIIDSIDIKKNIVNSALLLLIDKNMISAEDKMNTAIASFYYMLASKDKEKDNIVAAFKIVTAINEFYFNLNGKSLQLLDASGKDIYEREFNNVIKIHKINISEADKSNYELPIIALKDFEQVECKHCHLFTAPYDILCNNCHFHIANDYPTYYQNVTFNISFENNDEYNITFCVPKNLKIVDNGSGGYFTLMDEVGPSFISYKFFNRSIFYHSTDKRIGETRKEIYFGKELKTEYVQKENGNVLFTSEIKFSDNLYGIMEYQINNAQSVDVYNERDIKKYLAILYCVVINGNGYVDKVIDEKSDDNSASNISTNNNKKSLSGIFGIVILIVLIVGGIILFG